MSVNFGTPIQTKPRLSPIQLLLLVQLEGSPKYGYEMLKAMRDELKDVWTPKTGTIYPALYSLEKHGLIKRSESEGTGFFHITPKGRAILEQIGQRQSRNYRFFSRTLVAISKWISPVWKRKLLESIVNQDRDDFDAVKSVMVLIEKDVDPQLSLSVLYTIRSLLEQRLREVDEKIKTLEGSK
jgi:DNA-binding PadR family transcriptional regulator